jgi:hypothetical protein
MVGSGHAGYMWKRGAVLKVGEEELCCMMKTMR